MNLLLNSKQEGDQIAQKKENITVFIHGYDVILANPYSALYD